METLFGSCARRTRRTNTTSFPIMYNKEFSLSSSWYFVFHCKIEGKSSCHVTSLTVLTKGSCEDFHQLIYFLTCFVLIWLPIPSEKKTDNRYMSRLKISSLWGSRTIENKMDTQSKWKKYLFVGYSPFTGSKMPLGKKLVAKESPPHPFFFFSLLDHQRLLLACLVELCEPTPAGHICYYWHCNEYKNRV